MLTYNKPIIIMPQHIIHTDCTIPVAFFKLCVYIQKCRSFERCPVRSFTIATRIKPEHVEHLAIR